MGMARTIAILGAGLGGYQAGQDDKRKRQREEENDAWTRKQRGRMEAQWARDDAKWQREEAEREAVETAAKPVMATAAGERPPEADDRDVGLADGVASPGIRVGTQVVSNQAQADAAMAEANSLPGTLRRVAGAVANPMARIQMQQQAQQAEVAGLQLDKLREERAHELWIQKIGNPIMSGDADAIARALTENKADGLEGKSAWRGKTDGKVLTVYPVGPDGTALAQGISFEDSEEGRLKFLRALNRRTPIEQKLADIRADKKLAAELENLKRDDDRAAARDAETARHNKAVEGIQARAAAARAAGAATPEQVAVWDKAASDFLRGHYQAKDPMSGASVVDGIGLAFAKRVALARAQANGGDLDAALGEALAADAKLRTQAGNDPAKLEALRSAMLTQWARGPQAPAASTQATARRSEPSAPAAGPAARMAGAAPPETTADRVRNEAIQKIVAANETVRQARSVLAAVSNSGDPRAMTMYAQQLQQAINARNALAESSLGNGAAKFLSTLPE